MRIPIFMLVAFFFFSIALLNGQKRISLITFKDSTVVNGFAKFIDHGKEIQFIREVGSNPMYLVT